MTNLVPKKVVDKNGVLTTRMVRPEQGSINASRIPPPATKRSTEESVVAACREIMEVVEEGVWNNYAGERRDYSGLLARKLSAEGVRVAHQRILGLSDADAFSVGQHILDVFRNPAFSEDRDGAICTMIDSVPVVRDFGDRNDPRLLANFLAPLHLEVREHVKFGAYPNSGEEERSVRYLAFRLCMGELAVPTKFKEEAEWFNKNYEKLIPHSDMIRNRKGDIGWMKELVGKGIVVPLSKGLL